MQLENVKIYKPSASTLPPVESAEITTISQRYCEPITELTARNPLDVQDDINYNIKYGDRYVTNYEYKYNNKSYHDEWITMSKPSETDLENKIKSNITNIIHEDAYKNSKNEFKKLIS